MGTGAGGFDSHHPDNLVYLRVMRRRKDNWWDDLPPPKRYSREEVREIVKNLDRANKRRHESLDKLTQALAKIEARFLEKWPNARASRPILLVELYRTGPRVPKPQKARLHYNEEGLSVECVRDGRLTVVPREDWTVKMKSAACKVLHGLLEDIKAYA